MSSKPALLFDVDGTLLKAGGPGKRAMNTAFEKVFGVPRGMDSVSFAGSTDLGVYAEALAANGLEDPQMERFSDFEQAYCADLQKRAKEERQGWELLPGVVELLEELNRRGDFYLSLVTGNFREGARIKLSVFGLEGYFQDGAFGDDHADRNLLPDLALRRLGAKRQGSWVIGDTVKDVLCAHACSLPCLAVRTGFSSEDELRGAGVDLLIDDFSDRNGVLELLGNGVM